MILLAGIPSEPPIALAVASAASRGIPYLLLNQRSFSHDEFELTCRDGRCSGAIAVAGRSYPLECFAGVYLRTIDAAGLPELKRAARASDGALQAARAHAWADMLTQWTEVAPQRVANRLSATLSN